MGPSISMKPFARDPFTLMAFHRLLISTAVAACLFFGVWQIYRNYDLSPVWAVVKAIIAWVLAVGLVVYLVRIRGKR
jgi:hypothetical protein